MAVLITARTEWPLSLDGVKDFLQETESDNDALINLLIRSATDWIERKTGLILNTTTFEQTYSMWPACNLVKFRWNPVQSFTVKYVDPDGAEQTVSSTNYAWWVKDYITRVAFNDDYEWPQTDTRPEAWKVRYVAGYNPSYTAPDPIKHAMLMRIRKAYDNRQDEIQEGPTASDHLIEPYLIYH